MCAKQRSIEAASVTSSCWMSRLTPAACAAARSASALAGSRRVATTVKPLRAAATAVARPMPEDVPVTRRTDALTRSSCHRDQEGENGQYRVHRRHDRPLRPALGGGVRQDPEREDGENHPDADA